MGKWLTDDDIFNKYSSINLVRNNTNKKGGIPIAYKNQEMFIDDSENHSIVIGSTGSKKSRLIAIPTVISLIKSGENIIISDPKNEIYTATHNLAKREGYEIIKLNFRNLNDSNSWNPFELLSEAVKQHDGDKIKGAIRIIADSLIITKDFKTDYWDTSAKEFLSAVLKLCVLENDPSLANFLKKSKQIEIEIEKCYYEKNDNLDIDTSNNTLITKLSMNIKKKYTNMRQYEKTLFEEFKNTLISYSAYAPGLRTSIIATLNTNLMFFTVNNKLIEKSKKSDFSYGDIINKKIIFYLIIPEENNIFENIIKIFVDQSYSYIISNLQLYNNSKAPRRINYVLDEFANIPSLNNFATNISISRSRNIRFILFLQNLSQLSERYGHSNANTITSNCNNYVYLYSNDDLTNEFIHSKINDKISLAGMKSLSKERGEVLFLFGRNGEYISTLKDMSQLMEMIKNG